MEAFIREKYKTAQAERMVAWCEENVSPSTYSFSHLNGAKIGGEGWQIYVSGNETSVVTYIEDESLKMFFTLAFVTRID